MKRNYLIDYIKVIFAISIACSHYKGSIFSAGMIVNCFFVLSGYFLMTSYESRKYENAYTYTKNRIKKIYPQYIVSFFILFIYTNRNLKCGVIEWIETFVNRLPEIFLLQNLGIFDGGINYPLWQLCTLIFVSHVLYSLLEKDKKFTLNVICPILVVLVYTYFANIFGTHDVDPWGIEYKFLYVPLLRAFASTAIGMIVYYPINELSKYISKKWQGRQISLCSLLSCCVFWVSRKSYISIIAFCIILLFCLTPTGIFAHANKKPPFSGEKLSLGIYFNQAFLINIFNDYYVSFVGYAQLIDKVIFIAVLIVYSIVLDKLISYVIERRQSSYGQTK